MSPHRQFTDDRGLTWQAWDVFPHWGERRSYQRRQLAGQPPEGTRERRISERRTRNGIRIGLSPRLTQGWLAFECQGLRRRIAPIPGGWHQLSDEELSALLRDAEEIAPRRGRLVE